MPESISAPQLKGYSLWFMPTGPLYRELAAIIEDLSKANGTEPFEPHITLLGEIEGTSEDVINKTKALVSRISAFKTRLKEFDFQTDYYRCLYLKVDRTEEILVPQQAALRAFGRPPGKGYWPHLSLMYGSLPNKEKEQIISKLELPAKRIVDVRRLHVYSTQGGPKDWFPVRGFDLQS